MVWKHDRQNIDPKWRESSKNQKNVALKKACGAGAIFKNGQFIISTIHVCAINGPEGHWLVFCVRCVWALCGCCVWDTVLAALAGETVQHHIITLHITSNWKMEFPANELDAAKQKIAAAEANLSKAEAAEDRDLTLGYVNLLDKLYTQLERLQSAG